MSRMPRGLCYRCSGLLDPSVDLETDNWGMTYLPAICAKCRAPAAPDELATLRARVAELEAHCQRLFLQVSDDGERIAVLTAVVERVRAKLAAWKAEAAILEARAWTKGSTEGIEGYGEAQRDCADELEAILPPKETP